MRVIEMKKKKKEMNYHTPSADCSLQLREAWRMRDCREEWRTQIRPDIQMPIRQTWRIKLGFYGKSNRSEDVAISRRNTTFERANATKGGGELQRWSDL